MRYVVENSYFILYSHIPVLLAILVLCTVISSSKCFWWRHFSAMGLWCCKQENRRHVLNPRDFACVKILDLRKSHQVIKQKNEATSHTIDDIVPVAANYHYKLDVGRYHIRAVAFDIHDHFCFQSTPLFRHFELEQLSDRYSH